MRVMNTSCPFLCKKAFKKHIIANCTVYMSKTLNTFCKHSNSMLILLLILLFKKIIFYYFYLAISKLID